MKKQPSQSSRKKTKERKASRTGSTGKRHGTPKPTVAHFANSLSQALSLKPNSREEDALLVLCSIALAKTCDLDKISGLTGVTRLRAKRFVRKLKKSKILLPDGTLNSPAWDIESEEVWKTPELIAYLWMDLRVALGQVARLEEEIICRQCSLKGIEVTYAPIRKDHHEDRAESDYICPRCGELNIIPGRIIH